MVSRASKQDFFFGGEVEVEGRRGLPFSEKSGMVSVPLCEGSFSEQANGSLSPTPSACSGGGVCLWLHRRSELEGTSENSSQFKSLCRREG